MGFVLSCTDSCLYLYSMLRHRVDYAQKTLCHDVSFIKYNSIHYFGLRVKFTS